MSGHSHHHHHHHLHNTATCSRHSWIASALLATGLAPAFLMRNRHFVASTLIIWIVTASTVACSETAPTQEPRHHRESERQMHPSLFVDAKMWRGTTEFGERSNWLAGRKPCSLLERVAIDQNEAVISMGDAMDSVAGATSGQLKSDIKEFVLPMDGLLLLEDDTLAVGARDSAFLQMLNDTGDCFDSSTLPDDLQQATWFKFQPHPNSQSWFNPSNWHSLMNVADDGDGQPGPLMVPESHQIPCAEDVVLFGSRRESLFLLMEPNTERSRQLAFKVNFRASGTKRAGVNLTNWSRPLARTLGLRVAKLKIGDKSYTQAEFDELAAMYGNKLFQFRDELSALGDSGGGGGGDGQPPQVTLTIDESSIQATHEDFAVCLEDPGCECGNEQPAIMDIICSFIETIEMHQMPCRDPIQSAGYCNKICATSVSINMDPSKFSERFVASLVNKIITGQDETGSRMAQDFSGYIFIGSRRVDHNKYEITLRISPADNSVYTQLLGQDLKLAQLIKEHLERAATKSFYGIKTISIRSSVDWRRDNRNSILALTFIVLLPLAMTLFAKFDDHLVEIVAPLWQTNHRLANNNLCNLSMVSNETLITSDGNESIGGIESISAAAIGAKDNLAMVDLNADPTMGSTMNLLDTMAD